MELKLPITERARKYGYIIWPKVMDRDIYGFLGEIEKAEIWFENSLLGEKNIDWKHRRISIGYTRTRTLPANVMNFVLKFDKKRTLKITCQ